MHVKNIEIVENEEKRGFGTVNRDSQQFNRPNLCSEKYWAIFFRQYQSKPCQLSRCVSLTEALRTWKSLKSRKKWKSEVIGSMNRALQQFDCLNLGSGECQAVFFGQKQSKSYRLSRSYRGMSVHISLQTMRISLKTIFNNTKKLKINASFEREQIGFQFKKHFYSFQKMLLCTFFLNFCR